MEKDPFVKAKIGTFQPHRGKGTGNPSYLLSVPSNRDNRLPRPVHGFVPKSFDKIVRFVRRHGPVRCVGDKQFLTLEVLANASKSARERIVAGFNKPANREFVVKEFARHPAA